MMNFNTKSYKHLLNHRTAFYTLIFTLLLNIPQAWANSSYTVENIKVDVSASNAVEAREKALEEAQIKGYKKLAEKFLSKEELENLKTPDINTVSAYVKDFEVSKEKISATRYAGTYKIRYSAKAFASANKQANNKPNRKSQPKSQAQQGHILVFPFFEDSGYPLLWRTNPFMQAWIRARKTGRAVPAVVPRGDAQDISAISDSQALRYDPVALENLKNRYGTPQAAILIAVPELTPDGTQNLMVGIYKAKFSGPELSRQIAIRSLIGEGTEQFYSRVVSEINKVFLASWEGNPRNTEPQIVQNQQPKLTGPVQNIVAQVDFSTMQGWVNTKRSLDNSYGVQGVNVKSLSPRSATVIVSYQGGIDNLRNSLGQNGLSLNDPLTQGGQAGAAGGIYKISTTYQ